MKKLSKHDGDIKNYMFQDLILQTDSPGINYLFGKQGGMKAGYSMLLYGPPKSGKSLIAYSFAGHVHKTDPEAIVIKFDTEFRHDSLDHWAKPFGIDKERFQYNMTNNPEEIFDYIANDLVALIQAEMEKKKTTDPVIGNPVKLIIIDSLKAISYPKEANADKTTDNQMGDAASYLNKGFKKILPIIRKYKIGLISCQHVADNFDPSTARFAKYKIPGGNGLKHYVEYWMLVEKINSKDTKVFDSDKLDGSGRPIQLGHALRVKMEENSDGPQNRAIETDLSYINGLVNPHKEVATMAVNMGIVERPNNMSYAFDGKKWVGAANFEEAIKNDPDLQQKLIQKITANDPI